VRGKEREREGERRGTREKDGAKRRRVLARKSDNAGELQMNEK